MNRIFYAILLLFSLLWLNSSAQVGQVLKINFNGQLTDIGVHNHRIIQYGNGDFSEDRFGNPCSAYQFFDKNDYLEVVSSKALERIDDEFSLAVWVCPMYDNNEDIWLSLVCKGDDSNETINSPQFRVQLFQGRGARTISVNTEFTEFDETVGNTPIYNKKWNHIAVTVGNGVLKLYLNGVLTKTYAYNFTFNKNQKPLLIGRDIPGEDEGFIGKMDDLVLFDRVITEGEIHEFIFQEAPAAISINNIANLDRIRVNNDKHICAASVYYYSAKMNPCNVGGSSFILVDGGIDNGGEFPVGESTVVYKVADNNGATDLYFMKIVVEDVEVPLFNNFPDTISVQNGNVDLSIYANRITDNCSIEDIQYFVDGRQGSVAKLGSKRFNIDAYDEAGNKSSFFGVIREEIVTVPIVDTTIIQPPETSTQDSVLTPTIPTPNISDPEPDTLVAIVNGQPDDDAVETLPFTKKTITLVVYDNKKDDGDIVSLLYNGKMILRKKTIHNKDRKLLIEVLELDPTQSNELLVKAENMGKVGRNTIKIDFYDGELTKKEIKSGIYSPLFVRIFESTPSRPSVVNLNFDDE